MENLCRICLAESKQLVDLRKVQCPSDDKKILSEIYQECTSVDLRPEESSLICTQCKERLELAYDLRQQALQSTEYLRNGEMIKVESDFTLHDDYKEEAKPDEDEFDCPLDFVKFENPTNEDEIIQEDCEKKERKVTYKRRKKTKLKADQFARLSCKYCLELFQRVSLKKKCEKNHLALNGGLECDFCGKKFGKPRYLIGHINNMHYTSKSERPRFECDICHKVMSQKGVLYHHKKFQHSQNPEKDLKSKICQICGKGFNLTSTLKEHVKRHEGIKEYTCAHCNVNFSSRGSVKNHIIAIHFRLRLYHCEICKNTFSSQSALISHRSSVHLAIRKYICPICGKGFKRRSTLNVHKLMHSDEINFVCNVCGMRFRLKNSLTSHMIVHETNPVLYECEYCSAKFKRKASLKKHTKRHTGELHYCKFCQKGYASKSYLKQHLVVYHDKKKFKCGCGKEFVSPSNRNVHMKKCPAALLFIE